ncbi:MAG: hypothetical protein IH987_11255 [Planctomycetes bacterium]|nr:hypothetical protein [Planctomycetota bacterium]
MKTCTQFSIFLNNKPGVLTQILQELGKAKVNIVTISMMDSMEHTVLRMIVSNPKEAHSLFKKLSVPVKVSDVLAVTLPNRPGAAADLCDRLAAAHINIGYMYCTGGARGGKTTVVLKVPDNKKAMKILDGAKSTRRDMKVKLRRPAATRR